MEGILFGLDIGTTKVCAIVGEVRQGRLQIIGLGVEPSRGMRKGMVVDVAEAAGAIALAVEKAEQTSGYELKSALVSMAGEHLRSFNGAGAINLQRSDGGVTRDDVKRALEAAQIVAIPPDRELVHIVPRHFTVDDQEGVSSPLGMHGRRLQVEAHIVTASSTALMNLKQCAKEVGLAVEEFVLNVLASAEAVSEPSERDMGVIVADIGGGTTDIALFSQGKVWHSAVIPLGGQHITGDIAIGLRVPFDVAEAIKLQYGDCRPSEIDAGNEFTVKPFGDDRIVVGWRDLAYVVEARVEELFEMVLKSVKESGYAGLLPAGIVLTGGTAQLRGITSVAERILGVPARVASPKNLVGLVDALQGPAFATSVGLLRWAIAGHNAYLPRLDPDPGGDRWQWWRRWLRGFLPD